MGKVPDAQSAVILDGTLPLFVLEDHERVRELLWASSDSGGRAIALTDVVGEPVLVNPSRVTHVRSAASMEARRRGAVTFTP